MFDTIYIEKELPLTTKQKITFSNVKWDQEDFQTKCFENALSTYSLKKNGKLYQTVIDGEHVRIMTEAEEKKERKKNRWVWPYEFKINSQKEILEKHTGVVDFYSIIKDKDGNEWWTEFQAKFVDGLLKGKIKSTKFEINRTVEQIAEDEARWKAKAQEYNKKISTKIRKFLNRITFSHWYSFWNGVSRLVRYTTEKLNQLSFWIIRNIA